MSCSLAERAVACKDHGADQQWCIEMVPKAEALVAALEAAP